MSGTVGTNSGRSSGSVGAAASGPTVSASDPAIDTNATLGTQWANSSTGDFYVCTTATAGENVWTNVDAAQASIQPYAFPGTAYGYVAGGTVPNTNVIDRVSFSSDGDAVDVADILVAGGERTGCSLPAHGYWSNGYPPGVGSSNVIERMVFSTEANTTDVGNLTESRRNGSSSSSQTHCYWTGGNAGINIIERSADASSADAVDVGDLSANFNNAGNSSDVGNGYGYVHGSYQGTKKVIDRFQMAASASGSDVGDLAQTASHCGGGASRTYGYAFGGGPPAQNYIQKYAFGSSTSGSDIGNLPNSVWGCCAFSSEDNSYNMGADDGAGGGDPVNVISKISHSSDGDGSDIGNLTAAKNYLGPCGAQY